MVNTKTPPWLWLALLIIVSTTIKLIDISNVSLWIDEAYSFLVANGHPYPFALDRFPSTAHEMYQTYMAWQPLSWGQLISSLKQNVHMPMYYLLLNPWLHCFGNNEFGLRSFSTFWSALTLIPFYLLAYNMGKAAAPDGQTKRIAQWSTFFMALVPMQLFYAQEGRMYALSMFWAVTSALMLWLSVEHVRNADGKTSGKKTFLTLAGYTLSLLGGLFSHYMFLFYAVFHVAYIGCHVFAKPSKHFLLFLLPFLTCIAALSPWYPIYQIQQTGVWDNYHFAKGLMKPMRYINKFFLLPMESFANNNIFARIVYFPLAAVMFIGHFLLRFRQKQEESKQEAAIRLPVEGFLLLWLFVPMFVQCGYDIAKHTHTTIITRYLLLLTPVMPLMAGFVIQQFQTRFPEKAKACAYTLVGIVFTFSLASVLHHSPAYMHSNKKDINDAAEYLSAHLKPGDAVFTNGPLGAPNLLVFYLNQTHPEQPILYWMKDYAGKNTPLPDAKALSRFQRVWFFANRSDERRGLDVAKAYIQQYFSTVRESIDPDRQLDLYSR